MIVYESNRQFQIWTLAGGHRGLVLRSERTPADDGRVEIMFKPTDAVCLPVHLDGLVIETVDEAGFSHRRRSVHVAPGIAAVYLAR